MVIINKNSSNEVIFTLTENCLLTNPNFLFKLTSNSSNREYNFIAADTSTATSRYNKFTIIETGGTQNLTAGTLALAATDWYTYKIYEQSSGSNLVSTGLNMVETGLVYVSASTPSVVYTDDNPTITFNF